MRTVLALGVVILALGAAGPVEAQRGGRRVTTLEMLDEHRAFLHGEDVIVHAEGIGESVLAYLVDGEHRLLVLDMPAPPPATRERFEVIGTFYDVGRLQPDDARLSGLPIERLAMSLLNKPWPGVGELPLIIATQSGVVDPPDDATLRTVALDPVAFLDEGVTLVGRFRGRNLFGDLPDSPGESRYDFVLASADAAVWVVGMEPKGDDFELDVQARIDTGRWLEVTGSVRTHEGMVILDAGTIRLADPPATPPPPTQTTRRQGPPPEVIFSTPFDGDTDVPTTTQVRLQFSRDMDPSTFTRRIRVVYTILADRPDAAPPDGLIEFESEYRGRNRVLEISLPDPVEAFTSLRVELLEGITSSDGAPLAPYSMTFFTGR